MKLDAMVDIETVGKAPDCIVASVGIVLMDMDKLEVTDQRQHWTLDWASQEKRGRKLDVSTVRWWFGQDPVAIRGMLGDGIGTTDNTKVLAEIKALIPYGAGVWGNGADFDCVILQSLFRSYGELCPFTHKQHRCFRTVRAMYGHKIIKAPRQIYHNALDDALAQAQDLMAMLRATKGDTQGTLL